MSEGQPPNLEEEIRELRARVRRLEEALERSGIPLPGGAPVRSATEVVDPSATDRVIRMTGMPSALLPPPPPPLPPGRSRAPRSLESRIGSQWFNRIGILAVLVGVSWFLKLAVDNHWVAPPVRVLTGLVAGVGLIAWSERFRTRGFSAFSYSLKSIGSGILYLSLWAAFAVLHLISAPLAFAAMIAVTAFNGYLAWRQDAELLAFYALAGGFATPLLVAGGTDREIELFSYILLLDLAVVGLLALRPWSRLLFAAFVGTVFYAGGWWFAWYSADQWLATFIFFALFVVLFAVAPGLAGIDPSRMFVVRRDRPGSAAWDGMATAVLPVANAGLGFLGLYFDLRRRGAKGAEPWLAAAFALFYFVLSRPPGKKAPGGPRRLADVHLATAVAFVTLAIALALSGHAMIVGWFAEGAGLVWAAGRSRALLPRVLGVACAGLAVLALLAMRSPAHTAPVVNGRFATYLCGVAACGFIAWVARGAIGEERTSGAAGWSRIAAGAVLACNVLILVAVVLEIHAYWSQTGALSQGGAEDGRIYAQFSYSAFCMGFGAVLLGIGFWRESAFLRWQALVLLAASVAKVFVVDMSQLSQGYRILSFLGLGALLLGVSFVYQRDWLGLRGGPDRRP